MISLFGRILPRPTLLFKNKTLPLETGPWTLGQKVFKKPMELTNWACLRIRTSEDDIPIYDKPSYNRLTAFLTHLRSKGISVDNNDLHDDLQIVNSSHYVRLDGWFKDCLQQFNVNFLIVLLPDRVTTELYNHIKRYGDVKHGVHTVCVKPKKLGDNRYDENVALVSAGTILS